MALKTLSTFLSPLSLPKSRFPQHFLTTKPGLILCDFSRSQQSRLPAAESEGTGAAAPSPGEKFLERQQSFEAAKLIFKENKKRKIKKVNAVKPSRNVASCYGCGAPLHTSDAVAPGYVDPETYALKKKHRQLRTVLCRRCQLLSHGEMITAVGGHGGYPGGKLFVTAEELRQKLSHLRHEKALIVKLVDIVDFNGSFLSRVRDLAGSNPIILVVTKVDLLPRDTDLNCVGDWVVEATTRKKLNVLTVHLTSSKSLVGVTGVISEIQKEKKGRDVYILGSANVGKSAFINALLKTMAINDPVAASAQRYKPIQSAVPGTTLGPIQIDAFLGGGKLYDTPGVHLHHRQSAVVQSEDLPSLAPRSRLRGLSFPRSLVSADNVEQGASIVKGLNGFSIFWGGLVRIDVLKVLPETSLTFYGPKGIHIHTVPTEQADEFYQKELGVLLTPPSGGENVESWKGLESERKLQIKFEDVERPACDIAISGLGWFTVEPVGRSPKISQSKPVESTGELILVVRVPKPVEIFVRPPIPVGKAGAEWYQYAELTEKEEEMRPKCASATYNHNTMAPSSVIVTSRFHESITRHALRSYLSEFISTFFYVFLVVGSGMSSRKLMPDASLNPTSLVVVAIASAFALSCVLYIAWDISGGHVNPAVTFAMAVGGHVSVPTAIFYWVAQLIASVMACLVLRVIVVGMHVPTYTIAEEMTGFGASVLEGILTFVLVFTVYAARDPRRGPMSPNGILLVGFVAGAGVLAAGPFSGGSMNPACAFGSATIAGSFRNQAVYWVGPLIGATIAGLLYDNVLFSSFPTELSEGIGV